MSTTSSSASSDLKTTTAHEDVEDPAPAPPVATRLSWCELTAIALSTLMMLLFLSGLVYLKFSGYSTASSSRQFLVGSLNIDQSEESEYDTDLPDTTTSLNASQLLLEDALDSSSLEN